MSRNENVRFRSEYFQGWIVRRGSLKKITLLFASLLCLMVISTAVLVEAKESQTDTEVISSYKDVHMLYVSPYWKNVTYNGKVLETKNLPYMEKGRFMVPIHVVATYIGLDMKVDGNRVLLTDKNNKWIFEGNSQHASLNGEKIKLPVAAKGKGKQMQVPIKVFMDIYNIDFYYVPIFEEYRLLRYTDVPMKEEHLIHENHTKRRVGDRLNQWSVALPKDWNMMSRFEDDGEDVQYFEYRYDFVKLNVRLSQESEFFQLLPSHGLSKAWREMIYWGDYSDEYMHDIRVGSYRGHSFYEYWDSYSILGDEVHRFNRVFYKGNTRIIIFLISDDPEKVKEYIPVMNTFMMQFQLDEVPTGDIPKMKKEK